MNTRAKGSGKELQLKHELEAKGYLIEKSIHTLNHQDHFRFSGCDLLVLTPTKLGMISVTTIVHKSDHLKAMQAWPGYPYAFKLLYCYTDRQKGWRVFAESGVETTSEYINDLVERD